MTILIFCPHCAAVAEVQRDNDQETGVVVRVQECNTCLNAIDNNVEQIAEQWPPRWAQMQEQEQDRA
jgi:hypothetical protein